MTALLGLLPIFGFALIFNIYFKRKISVSIFFSITFIITTLFLFGMINILKIGTYLLFYGGILVLLFIYIRDKNKLLEFIKSIPFIIFTVASVIYLYFMKDAHLFFWDEFSHWGAFIKEMYYFNHFYDSSSVAAHLNYPPGISIWDYFLVMPTGYREGTLYFAYFLILFSSTLMMYEKLTFKQIHWIILIFFMQMVIFASFGHWFSSLYVDHIIGAMFAGLILTFWADDFKGKELALFIFPLISIVLIKEIGLYFGFASLGFFLITFILRDKFNLKEPFLTIIKKEGKRIAVLSILALVMVLALKSWSIRQESVGVHKEGQSIAGVVSALLSDKKVLSDKTETEVKKRFWKVVESQQVHQEKMSLNYNEFSYSTMPRYKKSIKLTTLGAFVFFILICSVAYFVTYRREKKIEIAVLGTYSLLISVIYLFILYLSYMVAFGNDALRIPSYVRYINMAIMPLMFIGFSFFLPIFQENSNQNNRDIKLFVYMAILVATLTIIVRPYFKPLYSQLGNRFKMQSDIMARSVLKYIPKKSKIFVLFPIRNNGSLNIILKYSLIPARTTVSSYNFAKKSSQAMINTYKKYDYIWFAVLNREIVNKNRMILKQKNSKQLYLLYKVEVDNGKINFKPVE